MITLATLPQATAQEVFDQVKNHLLAQGKQAMKGICCMYRGDNGTKCAAGCLISDEEYEENNQFHISASWLTLVKKGEVTNNHQRLIQRLQDVHDNKNIGEWAAMLKVVAKRHNLVYDAEFCESFDPQF